MPTYRTATGWMHLKLARSKKHPPPAPCAARIPAGPATVGSTMRCCAMSDILCDWKLADGGTCDAPLCYDHATEIGPDEHLCPAHAALRQREMDEQDTAAAPQRQGALF